jgi:hypothetical protein
VKQEVKYMVKRRIRAKNSTEAMKKARKKYSKLVVTKVNLMSGQNPKAKQKTYSVIARKRKK